MFKINHLNCKMPRNTRNSHNHGPGPGPGVQKEALRNFCIQVLRYTGPSSAPENKEDDIGADIKLS